MKLRLIFLAGFLGSISCAEKPIPAIQVFPKEVFLSRQASFNSTKFQFRIYVPTASAASERLSVMLYLHGADERGIDNEGQLTGIASIILSNSAHFPFIIVFPQCPSGRFWDEEMIQHAIVALDETIKEFKADESRIYLAGFSLGGYGVWTTAAMYPDRFAAVVAMSGRVLPRPGERSRISPDVLQLADADDPYAAYASRLSATPIWIFHGQNDNIVSIDSSRRMAIALRSAGNGDVKYTELENIGHVSFPTALTDPALQDWILQHHLTNK